jgi:hypothetical protein
MQSKHIFLHCSNSAQYKQKILLTMMIDRRRDRMPDPRSGPIPRYGQEGSASQRAFTTRRQAQSQPLGGYSCGLLRSQPQGLSPTKNRSKVYYPSCFVLYQITQHFPADSSPKAVSVMAELAMGIVALGPPVCAGLQSYVGPYKSFKGDMADFSRIWSR